MIRNSNLEEVDAFIVYARPEPKVNESSSNLLDGSWFIQTIGDAAEVMKIKVACKWLVVQEILNYARTKEIIWVSFLNIDNAGIILGVPTYDLGEMDETNPTYTMTFELAVMSDV